MGIHHLIKMVVASGISFLCGKIDSGNAAEKQRLSPADILANYFWLLLFFVVP